MARVLITGGAGFIGSHLAEYLLARNYQVDVLDDLSTGSLENVSHLTSNPDFSFTQDSVLNRKLVEETISSVDQVYHLAASVGVKLVVEKLVESIGNNVEGTQVILEVASNSGKKVLLTSTSEVYGRGDREIFSENDDLAMGPTTKGRWSYACSKALDEYLAFAYREERGLPVTVARLFNTVGEKQSSHYGMVVPTFVKQALAGESLTIHGDGKQSRCFCHVSDVVRALHELMEHPESDGEVYNIGSNKSLTINELANLIIKELQSSSEIVHIPYEEAFKSGFEDITKRVPEIMKIKDLINWQPTLDLSQIILKVRDHEIARQPA